MGDEDVRDSSLKRLTEGNLNLARALYRHSKILIAGLNGPAIGISAALLGHFDFVYAVENAVSRRMPAFSRTGRSQANNPHSKSTFSRPSPPCHWVSMLCTRL